MAKTSRNNPFASLKSNEDVAALLSTSTAQINYLLHAKNSKFRYKEFNLTKRRGGTRKILSPRNDLKHLQRKLATVLGQVYDEPRKVAYAFIKDRDIAQNADKHLRRRHVLNVDLKDFFPSINFGRIRGLFIHLNASPKAATILAQLCCFNDSLPQGAPTSPILSNMICMKLDRQLLELAYKHFCTYSRDADDLTFSKKSGAFPIELGRIDEDDGRTILGDDLRGIIEGNGFRPHPDKIWLFNSRSRQIVTGLVVNTKRNVRREWVRQLRAMIHAWKAHGLTRAEATFHAKYYIDQGSKGNPPSFKQVIRGKMEFLKQIKGERDLVYRGLQRRLVLADPSYFSIMKAENDKMKRRDVFISHASEDKKLVADELAALLVADGVSVWYDKYAIQVGDNIGEKIDEGLANSMFGVVIFSPSFFAVKKTWTKREYYALLTGEELNKERRILPIWHNITKARLFKKSPIIADRLAWLTSKLTVKEIATQIADRVRAGIPESDAPVRKKRKKRSEDNK